LRVENNCHSFFADTVDWWDIFLGDKAAGRYVHVAVQVRSGGVFSTRHVLINVSLLRGIFDSSILLFAFNQALFFVTSFCFFFRLHPLQLHRTTLLFSFAVVSSKMLVYFHLFSSAYFFYFYPLHQRKCSIFKRSSALKLDVVESNQKKKTSLILACTYLYP